MTFAWKQQKAGNVPPPLELAGTDRAAFLKTSRTGRPTKNIPDPLGEIRISSWRLNIFKS